MQQHHNVHVHIANESSENAGDIEAAFTKDFALHGKMNEDVTTSYTYTKGGFKCLMQKLN